MEKVFSSFGSSFKNFYECYLLSPVNNKTKSKRFANFYFIFKSVGMFQY